MYSDELKMKKFSKQPIDETLKWKKFKSYHFVD